MGKKGRKGKKGKKIVEGEDIELAECPSCEKAIPADATTCPECGEEFDEGFEEAINEPEDLAECPTCGKEIPADASKCPECGEDFDEGFDEEGIEDIPEDIKAEPVRSKAKKDKAKKGKAKKPKKEKAEKPKKEKMEKLKKVDQIKMTKELDQPTGDIKYTLLILGILLSLAGFIGVVGLRRGWVQSLLGDASPYPGIGSVEPMGHVVSIIPFVIGIVTIFVWGIKSEPLYIEKDKVTEEEIFDFEKAEDEEEDILDVPEPTADIARPKVVSRVKRMPKIVKEVEDLPDSVEEPEEPEDIPADIEAELDSLDEIGADMEAEAMKGPSLDGLAASLAEDERISLCNDALAAADVYDDDRKDLMKLIIMGLSIVEFREKVDEAEEKKRKAEEEKAKEFQEMSSDERGTSLEDELAAELAILEEELEDDDDDDLEDKILKEIEDLEDL